MNNINSIILFATEVCVADGLIHDNEIKLIEDFIVENQIDDSTKNDVYKIIGDTEDKKTLSDIAAEISLGGIETIKQALLVGLNIAYSDGHLDTEEENLFNEFLELTRFDVDEFINLKAQILKSYQDKDSESLVKESFTDKVIRNLFLTFKKIAVGSLKENLEREYMRMLLNSPEYVKAIEISSSIAKVDLGLVEQKVAIVSGSYRSILEDIDSVLLKKKDKPIHVDKNQVEHSEEQVYNFLERLQNNLRGIIQNSLNDNLRTLEKKHRALGYYTISFMGKTKAGKSTLHSIITGKGSEFIGEGLQRTTRYNRMYQWNNIRIIDTPGIGAPGGKTDEDIARSVIDETDLICYVLKNDSIQESEFEFLKLIKQHNKPIVILLNYKENIQDNTRFQIFLKDPNKWFTRSDEKNIEGHINRIRRYAAEHYKNDYFDIYPVHLLAARLSSEEQYKEYKQILYRSSRLEDFLNAIRVQIMENGTLKRTQTMIDGTIYIIDDSYKKLNQFKQELSQLSDKLVAQRNDVKQKISSSFDNKHKLLKEGLKNLFNNLIENDAMDFAVRHYDDDKDTIGASWNNYIKNEVKFEKRLTSKVKEIVKDYEEDIRVYLRNVEENLKFFSEYKLGKVSFELGDTVSFSGVGKLLGTIITLISLWTGLSWVVSAIGSAISFFSGLFKSKEQKIRDAQDKLYQSIKNSINDSSPKTINEVLVFFKEKHLEVSKNIIESFDSQLKNIASVQDKLNNELDVLRVNLNYLNNIYAYRIISYIKDNTSPDINEDLFSTISTERVYGSKFIITSNEKFSEKDEINITNIIQEQVLFIKRKGK